jgi:signal transduction histidine kinase
MSNAIKYRAPERTPQVVVKTEPAGQYVLLTVADNGLESVTNI